MRPGRRMFFDNLDVASARRSGVDGSGGLGVDDCA